MHPHVSTSTTVAHQNTHSQRESHERNLCSDLLFLTRSYEPELFPGLIYRMVKPRIVLLIFVSGKVVLTGKYSGSCMFELLLCLKVTPESDTSRYL